jgi:hypothetical protein
MAAGFGYDGRFAMHELQVQSEIELAGKLFRLWNQGT